MMVTDVLPVRDILPNDERVETPRVVAFQGERGAYGDLAIEARWGNGVLRERCWDFDGVLAAVSRGCADAGVLPVHNVIVGAIPGVEAAIARSGLVRGEEITVPVRHVLLGIPGSDLSTIVTVMSHRVALEQCGRFLKSHPWVMSRVRYDTAGAAREVAAHRSLGEAAIASEACASRYSLQVLARDIGDRFDNATRFVVVTKQRRA